MSRSRTLRRAGQRLAPARCRADRARQAQGTPPGPGWRSVQPSGTDSGLEFVALREQALRLIWAEAA